VALLCLLVVCSDRDQCAVEFRRDCTNITGCDNWSISTTSGGNYKYNYVRTKSMVYISALNGFQFFLVQVV
jgi:hypothetical protein